MKRLGLILLGLMVLCVAFLVLFPVHNAIAISWPKLESPETIVKECEFLLNNYPERSIVPVDEWPPSLAEIKPRDVFVKDGYVDIVLSSGGIGDSWGLIVASKSLATVPSYAIKTKNPRIFRYK